MGALGTGALAWYVPAVDLHRERSLISVVPNGGNHEYFYIGLPGDRIMVGLPNDDSALPADLAWPGEPSASSICVTSSTKVVVADSPRLSISKPKSLSTEATTPCMISV